MNTKPSRATDYLGHILQAIDRIAQYTDDMSEPAFLLSQITQDAVIRNLEIIGEAGRNIERHCPELLAQHPQLPLLDAYEMRNALAHGYFRVDLAIIWKTIENDLPALREQIEAIMRMSP